MKEETPEHREARLAKMREYSRLRRPRRPIAEGWRYRRGGSEYDSRVVGGAQAEYSPERHLFRCFFQMDCEVEDEEKEYKKVLINRVRSAGFQSRVLVIADGPIKRPAEDRYFMECQIYAINDGYPSEEQITGLVLPYQAEALVHSS